MRCGSTWLVAALGALPDVATDYEFKWRVPYSPNDLHMVVDQASPPISQLLDSICSRSAVVGSKFVFDGCALSDREFTQLFSKLDEELRIIHLIRKYRDIFLSRRRGFYHRLNNDFAGRIGTKLKTAIVDADIGNSGAIKSSSPVKPVDCYRELKAYLRNDASIARLAMSGRPYLRVRYDEITARMFEIARFAGCTASSDAIFEAMRQSPTVKLPAIDGASLVRNIAELEPLFAHFENLRKSALDAATVRNVRWSSRAPAYAHSRGR
jgi:hypothetical protein